MKNQTTFAVLIIAVALSLNGCSAKKETQTETHEHAAGADSSNVTTAPQFTADAAFQKQLADVFVSYASLKEAFVLSDPAKVKVEASSTITTLGKVDMKLLTGAAHHDWMTHLGNMESDLKEIASGTDIAVQRRSFSKLSNDLYKSIKAFGLGGETAYYEFCPMAFNNEGAFWLSKEEKIRNPYFGDEMLTCGEVKETLN